MKNRLKSNLLLASSFSLFLLGCNDADEIFSVRREIIDVGQAVVGDSVKASFTFKNNKREQIAITFLPECDCTTVSKETLRLKPRECGQIEVKVAVNNPGDFIKYVYVQASGEDDFLTIAVKGHVK